MHKTKHYYNINEWPSWDFFGPVTLSWQVTHLAGLCLIKLMSQFMYIIYPWKLSKHPNPIIGILTSERLSTAKALYLYLRFLQNTHSMHHYMMYLVHPFGKLECRKLRNTRNRMHMKKSTCMETQIKPTSCNINSISDLLNKFM